MCLNIIEGEGMQMKGTQLPQNPFATVDINWIFLHLFDI